MASKRSSNHNYAKTAYGVDIAAGSVIAVRATRGRKPKWERVDVGALTPDNLADLAALARKEKAWVAAAMPVKDSFTQRIEAPFPSEAKARKVFKSLLDIKLPFPVESCVCGFIDPRRTAEGRVESLAVGARSETVSKRIEEFNEAGMDPEILDHEGLAIWDLAQFEVPVRAETFRVVAYAATDRFVMASGEDGRFESVRNTVVEMDGEKPCAKTLASVSRKIKRMFPGAERPAAIEWIWAGEQAGNASYRAAVEALLDTEIPVHTEIVGEPSAFLARALAMRAVGAGGGYTNLRLGEFIHPSLARAKQREIRSLLLSFLVLGIVLCLGNVAWDMLLDRSYRDAQRALQSKALQVTGMVRVPRGREVEEVERWAERRKALAGGVMQFFDKSRGQMLLELMEAASKADIHIDTCDLQAGSMSLQGSSVDWDTPAKLMDLCGGYGYDCDLEREEAGADERIGFRIEGVRSEI